MKFGFYNLFQAIDGGILDIRNMTFADAGDYECIIKSAVGRIASRTSVFVYGPPGSPGKLNYWVACTCECNVQVLK
jgi:hypothetical protein